MHSSSTVSVSRGLSLAGVLLAVIAFCTVVAAPAADAAAAPVSFSNVPVSSWRAVGPGYATLVVGDTVYVGGSFSTVTSPNGATTVQRANLAAFSVTTGALKSVFRADTDGAVRALAYDGTNLYVGGSFTSIGGVSRGRLAAVDPVTGAVRSAWKVNATSHVYALAVDSASNTLYVGGAFGTIKGTARSHVAAVRLSDQSLTSFAPTLDSNVRSLAVAPDSSAVYLGGWFTTVDGQAAPYLAKLTPAGALLPVPWQRIGGPALDLSINTDGSRLAVGIGGQGTDTNQGAWYDAQTGQKYFDQRCDGDGQAVLALAGSLFSGFHEACAGDTTIRLTSNATSTGVRDPDFHPSFDMFWGVRDIAGDTDHLVIAGEFTKVSGVPVQGFAIFPSTSLVANTAPRAVFTSSVNNLTASHDATGSSDADGSVTSYAWDFGDGQTGTGATVAHTYASAGSYPVTLTVRDNAGASSSSTKSVSVTSSTTDTVLLGNGSAWHWRYAAGAPPTGWNTPTFDTATWNVGNAVLGFGSSQLGTNVDTFATTSERPLAEYYTRTFDVPDASKVTKLTLTTVADDGVVVYVNGTEVGRSNMPSGTVSYTTYASSARNTSTANSSPVSLSVPTGLLVNGANTVSAETHLNYHATRDTSFDLRATAALSQ